VFVIRSADDDDEEEEEEEEDEDEDEEEEDEDEDADAESTRRSRSPCSQRAYSLINVLPSSSPLPNSPKNLLLRIAGSDQPDPTDRLAHGFSTAAAHPP
jgi:hypothetical protein